MVPSSDSKPIPADNEKLARGKRVRDIRDALRYSTREFEKKHGVKASTIKSWERGEQGGLTADGALKLIAAFREEGVICTLDWLFYGEGADPLANFKVSPSSNAPLSEPNSSIAQELQFFHQLHPGAVDFIVGDDGMEPYFFKGDHVAGVRYFENEIYKLVGLNCVVQLQSGQVLARRLLAGEKEGCYTLSCMNPCTTVKQPSLENIKLFSAASIIWIRKPG